MGWGEEQVFDECDGCVRVGGGLLGADGAEQAVAGSVAVLDVHPAQVVDGEARVIRA
jgi:hypothetical protein